METCEKVLGQVGIAFHSPVEAMPLIGHKENSQQISSCLRSVAKRASKNKKSTHDNSPINY